MPTGRKKTRPWRSNRSPAGDDDDDDDDTLSTTRRDVISGKLVGTRGARWREKIASMESRTSVKGLRVQK